MKPFFLETPTSVPFLVGDIETRLRGVSRLSMACYLEGIPHHELPLNQEKRQALEGDLSRINAEAPLMAYTFCVRHLADRVKTEDCV
jgi:hypothetical protein